MASLLLMLCSVAPLPQPYAVLENTFTVRPADLNHSNILAGGKTFDECDRLAGTLCRSFLKQNAVTKEAKIKYLKPGKLANIVTVRAKIIALQPVIILVTVATDETIAVCRFVFIEVK